MISSTSSRRAISAAFLCAVAVTLGYSMPAAQAPAAGAGDGTTMADARHAQFLQLFARAYFPGRTGQVLIVPREGHILTRSGPDLPFMHGSPWAYDSAIPILFVGPQVMPGVHATAAAQQDIAVTLAATLGISMPPTATGRVLPVLRANAARPRAVFLLVLDAMRADYFTRHAARMPTLTALRKRGAWFSNARINYLPTNTASGHSTISTGADPRVHGINGNNLFDRTSGKRHDMYAGWSPRDLMALTLSDVWQLETRGRGLVIVQGGNATSSTALAGHGACQLTGSRVFHAAYDETSGTWKTNPDCYKIAPQLAALDARTVWPSDGTWMGHKVDNPALVRRSALFPSFEADAFVRTIEAQPIGQDEVPDLLLMNIKSADYVSHRYGPDSPELAATLVEIDKNIARILAALEAKVGRDYMLAITADHGMPPEPTKGRSRRYASDVADLLNNRFDPDGKKVIAYYEPENAQIFVDLDRLAVLKLSLNDIAAFLRQQPFIEAAFTEDDVRRAAARLK
jgi:predicted AlkP superfamily pyrophosphatase or phosphodiesterase